MLLTISQFEFLVLVAFRQMFVYLKNTLEVSINTGSLSRLRSHFDICFLYN